MYKIINHPYVPELLRTPILKVFFLQNNQGDGYKSNNMGLKWQILYDFIYKI